MDNPRKMKMERMIFHIDVNSAFLSWSAVERLKKDPTSVDLRTIPSGVGGDTSKRKGVITARSLPAKAYGVQTGEPVVKAIRKCPELVLVGGDFQVYRAYSKAFISLLYSYTPLIEQVSIDEAYLDMTDQFDMWKDPDKEGLVFPLNAAAAIRNEIKTKLGFTVNIGISQNKLLAKMASDFEKPDKTHTLYRREIREKLWPLPIRKLHGCGPATANRLRDLGLLTIGDAAAMNVELLKGILGEKAGDYISKSANGISDSPVRQEGRKAKGYSNETTSAEDISQENYEILGREILHHLSHKVAGRLQRDHVYAFTISVNLKTDEFKKVSRQITLEDATNDGDLIERLAEKLMEDLTGGQGGLFARGRALRLIGVSATNLTNGDYRQMTLQDLM